MMTDPIADMLTRIRNAVRIERTILDMPASHMRRGIAQVLKDEGYIWDFEEIETVPARTLRLHMKYGPNGERLISRIDRVSKPGRRIYMGYRESQADPGGHGDPDPEHAPGRHQRPPRAHREGRRRGPGAHSLNTRLAPSPARAAGGTFETHDLIHQSGGRQTMSRIGRKPVPVPTTVKVAIADSTIQVEGPKGKLSFKHRPEIDVNFDQAGGQILVTRQRRRADQPLAARADPQPGRQHGPGSHRRATPRSSRSSASATRPSSRRPTPWRSRSATPTRSCWKRRPGVSVAVPDPTHITISGPDKQAVGQFAAVVRKVRPPSRTRARGSATKASSSAARPARRSARSDHSHQSVLH